VVTNHATEDLLRDLTPKVLGALVRRYGHFDACEDALQEALLAAAMQWPDQGTPDNPAGWLVTVAARRLTDQWRSEAARQRREMSVATSVPPEELFAPGADDEQPLDQDDTLTLLFMCCHPALSSASQLALTLRAVGGLTTAQIARGFLTPEATMAQRISRAKRQIKESGIPFRMPPEAEREDRLRVVLHVLYLIFNEGYTATSGPDLHRVELTAEAIRLTRNIHQLLPNDGEGAGLLALMPGVRPVLWPMARWFPWRNRTGRCGIRSRSKRELISYLEHYAEPKSAPINSRLRLPPFMTKRQLRRKQTGRRFSLSTDCSLACRPIPWSRSTTPSRSRWCTARKPGSIS
jgi:RNA polymerase sigma factor (sigma-70 family)